MIQLTAPMRILVAVQPVDFRLGIDGLCRVCRQALGSDPLTGTVFVFRSRRATAIKLLAYDGQGFWLCHKRLSQDKFRHWPGARDADEPTRQLLAHQAQMLLMGGNAEAMQAASLWRSVTPNMTAA